MVFAAEMHTAGIAAADITAAVIRATNLMEFFINIILSLIYTNF